MCRHAVILVFSFCLPGLAAVLPPRVLHAQSVSLSRSSLLLQVGATVAGGEPVEATDNSTQLAWEGGGVGGGKNKITVETICPGQSFSLYVLAEVTGGNATGQAEVPLVDGMMPVDLIAGIQKRGTQSSGTAQLTYRAVATVAQGNSNEQGDDLHTVIFTILDE